MAPLHKASVIVIFDQLGLQHIYGLTQFIKKSKQFNKSDIVSDIPVLKLMISINRPVDNFEVDFSFPCLTKKRKGVNSTHQDGIG